MELQHLVKFQFAMGNCTFSVVGQTTDVLNLYSPLISSGTHYLQLLSSNSKKPKKKNPTGGRDLINFKNTHSDKQSPENKSARPILPLSLHLLFLGVCLLQTMVVLHWGLYIGMIDEGICLTQGPVFSVPVPMSAHCSSASVVIHTNDKKWQWEVSCCCCC